MSLTWPAKDPDDILDYSVDWTARLDGDTIATSVFSLASAAGLVIDQQSSNPTASTVWLSGGTASEVAVLQNRIVTAGGRQMDEMIVLQIAAQATSGGYGTDESFVGWLAANGYTLTSGLAPAVLRQRGSAYLDATYGLRFPGFSTGGLAQERAWPRSGARAFGADIADDVIPQMVIQASYAAAYQEDASPGSLSAATSTAAQVKREKIGPIETEYVAGSGNALVDATITLSAVEGLLAPLFCQYEPAIFVV